MPKKRGALRAFQDLWGPEERIVSSRSTGQLAWEWSVILMVRGLHRFCVKKTISWNPFQTGGASSTIIHHHLHSPLGRPVVRAPRSELIHWNEFLWYRLIRPNLKAVCAWPRRSRGRQSSWTVFGGGPLRRSIPEAEVGSTLQSQRSA